MKIKQIVYGTARVALGAMIGIVLILSAAAHSSGLEIKPVPLDTIVGPPAYNKVTLLPNTGGWPRSNHYTI